jgi:hypothetical protein
VQKSIQDTIRTSLPFRNILQNYLGNAVESDSDSEEEDYETTTETDPIDNISNHEDVDQAIESDNNNTEIFGDVPKHPESEDIVPLPQDDGFFSRPEHIQENSFESEKTVPINNPPETLQQQYSTESPAQTQSEPMLFPDAAADPET